MPTDILVSLDDRPGELARVGEALGQAGINIEGMMAFAHEGRGFAHVLVEDPSSARRALDAAGLKIEGESGVEIIDLDEADVDRPGRLGESARGVADAGINLRFVYLATHNRVVIGADDVDAVRRAMRR
jgi:ACT domain-containing protein